MASILQGTRVYDWGAIERVTVETTHAQSAAITSKEVLVHANTDCHILSGSDDPTATASNGIPLAAGEKFHLRIKAGDKISVIRDSADGYLHVIPVQN